MKFRVTLTYVFDDVEAENEDEAAAVVDGMLRHLVSHPDRPMEIIYPEILVEEEENDAK